MAKEQPAGQANPVLPLVSASLYTIRRPSLDKDRTGRASELLVDFSLQFHVYPSLRQGICLRFLAATACAYRPRPRQLKRMTKSKLQLSVEEAMEGFELITQLVHQNFLNYEA